jgi:hypothetical protein
MKASRRPLLFRAVGALHVRRAVVAVVHAAALEVLVPGDDCGQIGLVVRADNMGDDVFQVAVAKVLRDRPAEPVRAIGAILAAHADDTSRQRGRVNSEKKTPGRTRRGKSDCE